MALDWKLSVTVRRFRRLSVGRNMTPAVCPTIHVGSTRGSRTFLRWFEPRRLPMKIIIAAVASLAMAGSAFAALPSPSDEKRPSIKVKQLEFAAGKSSPGQTTTCRTRSRTAGRFADPILRKTGGFDRSEFLPIFSQLARPREPTSARSPSATGHACAVAGYVPTAPRHRLPDSQLGSEKNGHCRRSHL